MRPKVFFFSHYFLVMRKRQWPYWTSGSRTMSSSCQRWNIFPQSRTSNTRNNVRTTGREDTSSSNLFFHKNFQWQAQGQWDPFPRRQYKHQQLVPFNVWWSRQGAGNDGPSPEVGAKDVAEKMPKQECHLYRMVRQVHKLFKFENSYDQTNNPDECLPIMEQSWSSWTYQEAMISLRCCYK